MNGQTDIHIDRQTHRLGLWWWVGRGGGLELTDNTDRHTDKVVVEVGWGSWLDWQTDRLIIMTGGGVFSGSLTERHTDKGCDKVGVSTLGTWLSNRHTKVLMGRGNILGTWLKTHTLIIVAGGGDLLWVLDWQTDTQTWWGVLTSQTDTQTCYYGPGGRGLCSLCTYLTNRQTDWLLWPGLGGVFSGSLTDRQTHTLNIINGGGCSLGTWLTNRHTDTGCDRGLASCQSHRSRPQTV